MNKVIVRAPVRADLAGGTLDLWPLYLFHPGARTVNVAISFYAESEVEETGGGAIEIHLTDQQYRQRYESLQELSADPKAALVYRAVEHFHLKGISITTRTDAPRGSGLGGSSALSITLVRALSELAGGPVEGEHLISLVRDLETRLLNVPAGIQDYYPPVFGGLASLHLVPGAPVRHRIATPVADLAAHMLLHYTGVAHFSGTNNWEMYKRHIDGRKKIQKGMSKIAATSIEMEKALEGGDFAAAGAALAQEWRNRKALIDGISTPEIDAAIDAAVGAGAWGGKVCGAGGGGCVVFLFPPEKREAIERALADVPGRVLDVGPVQNGMTLRRGDDAHSSAALIRPRLAHRRSTGSVEQLYIFGGGGDYKPHMLAEGIITHAEPRSGVHQSITRTYVAPIDASDEVVVWKSARQIEPDHFDMRAEPDPERQASRAISVESLVSTAEQSLDSFRQFLVDSEKLRIFHNPAFGLYSEPGETRDGFVDRCMDEARRRLEVEQERLESSFRRRIDQLRERSEREQRNIDEAAEDSPDETKVPQNMNVAWGQALYNITSGRPAAVTEPPQSAREVDYRANIAQIQKAWDRALQTKREELDSRAQEIEEFSIVPSAKNIEITKHVILWM
ncbi:MAG TPA: hypothetical protein VMS98_00910 [Thermoanaerobaculia bacterium]|nr:hypothetical protein [Thermoanaerobaculia bacterium]